MAMPNWRSLGVPTEELRLEHTLPTGQSFRWKQTGEDEYTGVIGPRVVQMRQLDGDVAWRVLGRAQGALPEGDAEALHDYFNLDTSLVELTQRWTAACPYFAHVHQHFKGARMLRQDPVETLFQFLCSSNNHISRIQGMVDRLAETYGTEIFVARHETSVASDGADTLPPRFHAFPSLEQLSEASESELRGAGFGYRAKFVTGSVAALRAAGGAAWLADLRRGKTADAVAALRTLPGVGPKVAACVALFSLDAHALVPVDVHVAALAAKRYAPRIAGKALTPDVHAEVQAAFERLFGSHAGWAHNTLFISELARFKGRVPAFKQDKRGRGNAEEITVAATGKKGMDVADKKENAGLRKKACRARPGRELDVKSDPKDLESRSLQGPATPPQVAE